MSEKEEERPELDELTVRVPKPVLDYVAALCEFSGCSPEEFWTGEIISIIDSLIDVCGAPYTEKGWIIKKYNLSKILDC